MRVQAVIGLNNGNPGKSLAVMLVVVAGLVLVGCSSDDGDDVAAVSVDTSMLRVVTTVSPITSIAENVGGTRIILEGIVPEGLNSHTFEPAPSVARVMSRADLIILNGLFLEEPSLRMAEANKKDDAVILTLGDKSVSKEDWAFDFSFPESQGRPNPHLWTDPILALKYAELIKDQFSIQDPQNATYYTENYERFKSRIESLDQAIISAVATIPEENRRLLTYHDSFPYFAARYGFEVIGAVQPSDFTEPSAREVANLIDQIRETNVPAIFGSEVFPSKVMEQIAKEGGAKFVDQLRDDDLPGGPGDPSHSYLGLIILDLQIMVEALGGSAESLQGIDASLVFEGESRAIYPQ